jgi:hypothetical protein
MASSCRYSHVSFGPIQWDAIKTARSAAWCVIQFSTKFATLNRTGVWMSEPKLSAGYFRETFVEAAWFGAITPDQISKSA